MKRIPSRAVACAGKATFTAQQAKKAARHVRERGDRVVPYRRVHCSGWHIGNSLMREGKRGRRPRVQDDGGLDG